MSNEQKNNTNPAPTMTDAMIIYGGALHPGREGTGDVDTNNMGDIEWMEEELSW